MALFGSGQGRRACAAEVNPNVARWLHLFGLLPSTTRTFVYRPVKRNELSPHSPIIIPRLLPHRSKIISRLLMSWKETAVVSSEVGLRDLKGRLPQFDATWQQRANKGS